MLYAPLVYASLIITAQIQYKNKISNYFFFFLIFLCWHNSSTISSSFFLCFIHTSILISLLCFAFIFKQINYFKTEFCFSRYCMHLKKVPHGKTKYKQFYMEISLMRKHYVIEFHIEVETFTPDGIGAQSCNVL